jgi:hypothetical protein
VDVCVVKFCLFLHRRNDDCIIWQKLKFLRKRPCMNCRNSCQYYAFLVKDNKGLLQSHFPKTLPNFFTYVLVFKPYGINKNTHVKKRRFSFFFLLKEVIFFTVKFTNNWFLFYIVLYKTYIYSLSCGYSMVILLSIEVWFVYFRRCQLLRLHIINK